MPLLHDLVASAPIDADRMDYMERDSRSIGVSYGLYDKERLLKSFLVYYEKSKDGVGKTQTAYRLGIKLSGVRAVENFVQARFELFVQIYYHKTNRAIELMFREIGEVAAIEQIDIFNINNTKDLVDAYSNLSDVRFLRLLQNKDEIYKIDSFTDKKSIIDLAEKLAKRELWKRVFEGDQDNLSYIYNKLCEGTSREILFDRIDPKATKDLNKGAALLKRGQDGYYSINGNTSEGWTGQSKMIKALEEEEKTIGRIYYKGSSIDNLKSLRDQARQVSLPEKQTSQS
ncbi:hypothetical protein [Spirosoma utsteinense]|uniref:HD superfamily phosphohydrolase n=1 Tax=Spirosoma utsteinense TaxID=2585773 RepID=A0ABR6WAN4_9BACT|nr:hypothetical protein [Spirosoma utsteinense]MBC3789457.1 HD superfamily phosphohydrolase [Spirosoma utsteinense]MBC3793017.1 HD superfamily phosphohydrolase [Spirosoma utsteinense]